MVHPAGVGSCLYIKRNRRVDGLVWLFGGWEMGSSSRPPYLLLLGSHSS